MSRKGILINYDYCTGCYSCEIACRVEHGYPDDQGGIIITQIGPWQYGSDTYQYAYAPVITDQCDQCAARLAERKNPTCVHHCQAFVMSYGDVNDLAAQVEAGSKSMLYYL